MRRRNADNASNITVSMVRDFFDLSAPRPTTDASHIKVKGRLPQEYDSITQTGINFKLMKTEDGNSFQSKPNLPTDADFPELSEDFENINMTDPTPSSMPPKVDEDAYIFENYSFEHTYSPKLPITAFQNEVLATIESNSVTVIQGATGSGKTTQVPQYILDHYIKQKRYCNIIVTQPRRIAAISIAKRVCEERSWEIGGLVGYQVARNKTISDDTRISYVTTGVLLQKLISAKSLNEYTHVILDEIHERDQDTDFALLVVRKLLRTNSKHVKVVMMSATLDSDMFSRYFSLPINGRLEGAPVVTVEGRSYPVEEFYLNDIIPFLKTEHSLPLLDPGDPGIVEEQYKIAASLIRQLDEWEIGVQGATDNGFAGNRGSVLVFLPGKEEIKMMDMILNDVRHKKHLWLLPLHSMITNEEQSQVFQNPPKPQKGHPLYRKVILSTNIAESSITVPDVKYVIDFCLVKCLICDPDTNYQSLRMQWTSHASATQRKGRAGRVSAGQCFRMVQEEFYERCMEAYSIPEFKRCPLEQIILKVKLLDLGAPKAILGLALEPPDVRDIERTVLILKEVGALTTKMRSGLINPYDGELTFLGRVIGELPVDIRVGKLLVLGHVFGVLEEALVIGACLSLKSFFSQPFKQELTAYSEKMAWSNYSHSDCIASLKAYKEWKRMKETGGFGRQREIGWCKAKFIQLNRIREVEELTGELTQRLARFNIRTFRALHQKRHDSSHHDELILKVVICGSFYPNYFTSGEIDEREAMKTMSGHDPFTTVMVKGLPMYGQHYSSAVARVFRGCGRGKSLHFEGRRAYIEFEKPANSPFPIVPAVYLAIKMRELRMPLAFYIDEGGQKRMIENTAKKAMSSRTKSLRTDRFQAVINGESNEKKDGPQELELPEVGFMDIVVSEVIDAGHFWAQPGGSEYAAKLSQLMFEINDYNNGQQLEPLPSYFPPGSLCLALFPEDERFYRAKIVSWKTNQVEVVYVDYGNICSIPIQFLRKIREEHTKLPFQAFECRLCFVRPTFGEWDKEATERFKDLTWDKKLVAKIYSRLHGALRVDLIDTVSSEDDIHIHQVLIAEGFGQVADESYDSIRAHEDALARLEVKNSLGAERDDDDRSGWIESDSSLTDAQLSGEDDRKEDEAIEVSLVGPFNPYEMHFYSMTCVGRMRATKIERDSVNSVALNDEPQDKHDRFLVASNIGINATGTVMIARDTTLMPNIHGLAALIGLVFAPCAEFRTDKSKDHYTGAIIGLGADPTSSESLLPDHDIELTFDFAFVQEDLVKINSCRNAINIAVGSKEEVAEWGTAAVQKIQQNSRRVLLELVLSPRDDRQMCPSGKAYRWNQIERKDLLSPYHQEEDMENELPSLYPLHYGVAVAEATYADTIPDHIVNRRMLVQRLHEQAGGSSKPFPEAIVCELCNVSCRHPRGLRMHLETRAHRMEENVLFDDRYVFNR